MKSLRRTSVWLAALALVCLLPIHTGFAWETNDPASEQTAAVAVGTATTGNSDYKINPGDILNVSVWREPDLTQEILVRPDGKISFPLAGDVQAAGNSVDQVRELLRKQLEELIPDVVVSVSILQINGNKIFVIGQVNQPGEINANPYIDVVQALSIAGGANAFANVSNISILRRTDNGQISIPFDYGDIEKGKKLEQNIILQAGDIVVVP
jgi:polysaccharide export outer membrane protein